MKFRTEINLTEERNQFNYESSILLVGSCFSENIYKILDDHKFKALKNPFGILYNPTAIETFFRNVINQKEYTKEDIFCQNERWHCFDAHSDLSAVDPEILIKRLNEAVENTYKHLRTSSHVFITLGSAWVYRYIASDTIVGNCHKVPNKKFLKELLSIEEISDHLLSINTLLKDINPTINIVYNVSPIRHLKDGFVDNAVSKAHLIAGIHDQVDKYKRVHYFPSYEIMMDDLRDYRFYTEDLLHPNSMAINYIWEQFKQVWIEKSSFPLMKKVMTIRKKLGHKPFNPSSQQHQDFLEQLSLEIGDLERELNSKF